MNLVLIGFKASGKTTLGSRLATLLGKKYIDTDALVEKIYQEGNNQKLSCREIFTKIGEKNFRLLEELALFRMRSRENLVIATGGGIVRVRDAATLLRAIGHVVFLNASESLLEKRLDFVQTPLFANGNWRTLHAERSPLYKEAAHTVVGVESNESPEELARRVARCMGLYNVM